MRKIFKVLVKVEEAMERFLKEVPPKALEVEEVDLFNAVGRVLAEDVISPLNFPPFPRSHLDGYAVRAKDTWGAEEDNPVELKVKGRIAVGEVKDITVGEGEAVEVDTGSMIPKGADAVVPVENVKEVGDRILVFKPVMPGDGVDWAGIDVYKGMVVVYEGEELLPNIIGAIANLGLNKVKVRRRPKVCIIATGNELVPPGRPLPFGKVYDCNTYSLFAAAKEHGMEPIPLGIVKDDYEQIKKKILEGVERCDIVVTTGSTSAGPEDLVYRVVGEIGRVIVHGLAFKPGKPIMLGEVKGKPIFGLAGHPVSAYFNFERLVVPYVNKMLGKRGGRGFGKLEAIAGMAMEGARGRRTHIPVALLKGQDRWIAFPVVFESSMIVSLARAEGYVVIPEDQRVPIKPGEGVEVHLFRSPEYENAIIGDTDVDVDEEVKRLRAKYLPLGGDVGALALELGVKAIVYTHKKVGEPDEVIRKTLVLAYKNKNFETYIAPSKRTFLKLGEKEFKELVRDKVFRGYAHSPQAAASLVKDGLAEACLTTEDSAKAFGLEYQPLKEVELYVYRRS